MLLILSRISFAALFVKVIAKIFPEYMPSFIIFAILVVKTFVFPEPAPAKTRHGPSLCKTASFCSLFSPSNMFM